MTTLNLRFVTLSNLSDAKTVESEDGNIYYRHESGTWGDKPTYEASSFVFKNDESLLSSIGLGARA